MRRASSLTLGILKSLYPRADLDVVGEGFATTYFEDEANKLMDASAITVGRIMEMLLIDMPQVSDRFSHSMALFVEHFIYSFSCNMHYHE
jgi:hypothetical protein